MKLIFNTTFLVLSFFWLQDANGQCIKNISTNPNNPVNNEYVGLMNDWFPPSGGEDSVSVNSFLNTGFNWYIPNDIYIDATQGWDHPLNNYGPSVISMINPYDDAMPDMFSYLRPDSVSSDQRDFLWEDGWELLWMNLRTFPNGDLMNDPSPGTYNHIHDITWDPNPSDVPYFVLYNRYRGLVRLVANVWFDEYRFDDILVKLRFTGSSYDNNKLTGILRNASGYDRPLSQPTDIFEVSSPRFHSLNDVEWLVADFQVGYDPCTCNSQGKLMFEFTTINELSISLQGRSIAVEHSFEDSLYRENNFMNMSAVDGSYAPGTAVYQKMDDLFADYQENLQKYNDDLKDYQAQQNNLLITGMGLAKDMIVNGVAGNIVGDSLIQFVLETGPLLSLLDTADIDSAAVEDNVLKAVKFGLGKGYDFLSSEMYNKREAPKKPSIPVATFEEYNFSGDIHEVDTTRTSPLFLPGSVPSAYDPYNVILRPYNFPAYNEVLGTFALLEYPHFDMRNEISGQHTINEINDFDTGDHYQFRHVRTEESFNFKLSENIKYAINEALDVDEDKTEYYVYFELELKNGLGPIDLAPPAEPSFLDWTEFTDTIGYEIAEPSNFKIKHIFPDIVGNDTVGHSIVLGSNWYNIDEVGEVLFSANIAVEGTYLESWTEPTGPFPGSPNQILNEWDFQVGKLRMKIMPDFYFDQIGSNGEQVNVTQVFTNLLYDAEVQTDTNNDSIVNINDAENINFFSPSSDTLNEYTPGILNLSGVIIPQHDLVSEVDGSDIYIRAENIIIDGDLSVYQGYNLIVEAVFGIKMKPNSSVGPNVHLRIESDQYELGAMPPVSTTTITNYCQSDTYSADSPGRSLLEQLEEEALQEEKEEKRDKAELAARVFPNPSQGQFKTEIENLSNGKVRLEIFNMSGLRVHSDETTTQSGYLEFTIDLSTQSNGLYILRITDSEGKTVSERIQKL